MPRKPKVFKSEHAIMAAIHQCHREANQAIIEAESLETLAKHYFTMSEMVDTARMKKSEAQKLRQRANRLIDIKAKKLGEALAEFKTSAMPFLLDDSVRV